MLHIWRFLPVMSLQASNANVVQVVTYVGLYQLVLKIRYEPKLDMSLILFDTLFPRYKL